MRTVTPKEAKALRKFLLVHEARTLFPGCDDPDKTNLMLDHLRGMLQDIQDGELAKALSMIQAA